jgi:hypothetical protein
MVPKAITVIIISSFMLLSAWITPTNIESSPAPGELLSPPNQDEPPWYEAILESLNNAWEGIASWIDGAVQALQDSIAQAINQFLQGLIDEVTRQVSQLIEDIIEQSCGAALMLPVGAIAGVWYFTKRARR